MLSRSGSPSRLFGSANAECSANVEVRADAGGVAAEGGSAPSASATWRLLLVAVPVAVPVAAGAISPAESHCLMSITWDKATEGGRRTETA